MAWTLAAALLCATPALADPTVTPPPAGLALARHPDGAPRLALSAELALLMPVAVSGPAALADTGALAAGTPALTLARVGLRWRNANLAAVARIDGSEILRIDADTAAAQPLAALGRLVDDAALWWTPRVWAELVVGRTIVPFSRHRQLERLGLTSGLVPRPVERLAPDRRWGATFLGDLGALAYAAGVYADLDALELRAPGDPEAGGRVMAAAYLGTIPRAPIGADFMATPRADPWFGTARVAAGLGMLWRHGSAGHRLDASFNLQLKHRHVAAMGEVFARMQTTGVHLGGAAEASALLADRVALFVLLEHLGHGSDMLWSAGSGVSWLVTGDRRTRVTALGWLDAAADSTGHTALIALQGAL